MRCSRLYDASIGGPARGVVLDMIDAERVAVATELRGVDVGERWQPLAERWAPHAGGGQVRLQRPARDDGLRCAGRDELAAPLLRGPARGAACDDDNAGFTARSARRRRAPCRPSRAAAPRWRHAAAADPRRAHRFGGSHAQRDLLDLTLIEAALRSGDRPLAAALAAERVAMRPASPLARRFVARAVA